MQKLHNEHLRDLLQRDRANIGDSEDLRKLILLESGGGAGDDAAADDAEGRGG